METNYQKNNETFNKFYEVEISNIGKKRILFIQSENREIIRYIINNIIYLSDIIGEQFIEPDQLEKQYNDYYDKLLKKNKIKKISDNNKDAKIYYLNDAAIHKDNLVKYCIKFLDDILPKNKNSVFIIQSHIMDIPECLSNYIYFIKNIYPSEEDIKNIVTEKLKSYDYTPETEDITKDTKIEKFATDLTGLSFDQIDSVFDKMKDAFVDVFENKEYTKHIQDEYKREAEKDSTIEFIDLSEEEIDLKKAGMEKYYNWLHVHAPYFNKLDKANKKGVSSPKGCLLCGVPGTGKTLMAKATAQYLECPLVQFKIERINHKYVGESERNMRKYLDRINSMGKCVMLIDEIEKVFEKTQNTHETTTKLIGMLLDWLQKNKNQTFVFFTANKINNLPPEMLRDGRLSERFFVGMPSADNLTEIIIEMLKKRNKKSGWTLIEQDKDKFCFYEKDDFKEKMKQAFNDIAKLCLNINLYTNEIKTIKEKYNLKQDINITKKYPFMTGANLDKLLDDVFIDLDQSKKTEENPCSYTQEEFINTFINKATAEDFIPEFQSNTSTILNLYNDAKARQYRMVSTPVIEYSDFEDKKDYDKNDNYNILLKKTFINEYINLKK